ncbi:MAG: hypothetical protein GYA14_13400 [Ignavibacteria bacterium]|nr:hypothetical protein [Ignavibacteria bacterium]
MLRITLEPKEQFSNVTPTKKEDLDFELKVVTEGLFPEVRLSFVSDNSKKRFKDNQTENLITQKNNLFR